MPPLVPSERTLCAVVLAHQGGWDETLLVIVPLVIIAVLLVLANRRAKQLQALRMNPPPPDSDSHTAEASELPPD